MSEQKLRNRKKWLLYIVMLLIPVVTISLIYLTYTTYRASSMYNSLKSNQRGWSGKVWRSDRELGFAHIPNSNGFETMPIGANIPARFDKDGFRIPIQDRLETKSDHPVVLTLGCSFTYGAATKAEDTFPYLVGKYIGGSTMNAGVSSYGLSQMEIISKQLIPQHKPDYVIVQYSDWLVDRAIRAFAPSRYGKDPNPFYTGEDNLTIKPPVFQAKIEDLPVSEYRHSKKGTGDFISFLWNVGLPLFIYDDFNLGIYILSGIFKLNDQPTTNRRAVIQHAYGEIQRVVQQNGAKMIIVVLGYDNKPVQIQRELLPSDVIIVDAQSALLKQLATISKESYARQYYHWRGDPAKMVDSHPNEKAHKIIAEEIVKQIVATRSGGAE